MQITTASVIKAQVLGAVLLRAQDEGRGLTAWERSQIAPMIQYSFNPETSALYGHLGYAEGLARSDPRFGVTSPTHTNRFGLTPSTAIHPTERQSVVKGTSVSVRVDPGSRRIHTKKQTHTDK